MDLIKGIASLLVILSILVIVHEWGHYIVAKIFGMRVEEFALFFGKILVRLGVRNGTEYNIRAIPLGGFVRIAGMDPNDISDGRAVLTAIRNPLFNDAESMARVIRELDLEDAEGIDTAKITDDIRKTVQFAIGVDGKLTPSGKDDLEALKASPRLTTDEHRFIDLVLKAHSRAVDTNLYNQKPIWQRSLTIFAGPFMSLFFGYLLFCIMGMTLGFGETNNEIAGLTEKDSPARLAGLQVGDKIVSIDNAPTPVGKAVREKLQAAANRPLHLTVQRGPQTVNITVTPKPADEPTENNGKRGTKKVGRIGIQLGAVYKRLGPVESISMGSRETVAYVRELFQTLLKRGPKETLGGPIAMGQMATAAQKTGFSALFTLTAILSLSLGIMNLLPIPILDGGHLLLLAVEKVRRRKLSPREAYRAQLVGLGILALLICFVTYNDIVRWIGGRVAQ
jgi:regulator of sigma E protease